MKRRSFTPEFRAEAVKLVREGGKSLPQVAKDVDGHQEAQGPRTFTLENVTFSEGKAKGP